MTEVTGVAPGFLLLPAREYKWKLKKKIEIRIPIRGKISELLDENAQENLKIHLEDDFDLKDAGIFYLWQVTGVLFASSQYPQLADNEVLNVVAIETTGEELVLYGEIIQSVE
jgi:hypothetical protein